MKLGIQTEGQSSDTIKKMAMDAFSTVHLSTSVEIADIGAGRGDFGRLICPFVGQVTMVDDSPPIVFNNDKIDFVKANLNERWNLADGKFDFVFSLEVIEHIENPRHFMREIHRILRSGGYGFISTPNNLNLFSRLNFFFNGEHRYFQDSCYPAHISCLVKKDFERLLKENAFQLIDFFYNYEDVLPLLGIKLRLRRNILSNSIGVLFKKQF